MVMWKKHNTSVHLPVERSKIMFWLNLCVTTVFVVTMFALPIRFIFGCSPWTSIMISFGWLAGGTLVGCGAGQWIRNGVGTNGHIPG